MNLFFEYLYRDSGNFKKWGCVIFSNKNNIPKETIEKQITANLDEGLFFKADDLNIPDLHFDEFNPSIDHIWHEYHDCFNTKEPATDANQRDIITIIEKLSALNKEGIYYSGC